MHFTADAPTSIPTCICFLIFSPVNSLEHSKPFLYFHFVLIQNTSFPIIYYELFISFNENENKPSWIYLFHNGFFHFSCQKLNCAETAKVLGAPRPILLPPAAYQ